MHTARLSSFSQELLDVAVESLVEQNLGVDLLHRVASLGSSDSSSRMIGRRAAVSRRGPGSGDGKATRVYAVLAAIGWVIHGWGRGPALCLTSVRLDRGLRVQ